MMYAVSQVVSPNPNHTPPSHNYANDVCRVAGNSITLTITPPPIITPILYAVSQVSWLCRRGHGYAGGHGYTVSQVVSPNPNPNPNPILYAVSQVVSPNPNPNYNPNPILYAVSQVVSCSSKGMHALYPPLRQYCMPCRRW